MNRQLMVVSLLIVCTGLAVIFSDLYHEQDVTERYPFRLPLGSLRSNYTVHFTNVTGEAGLSGVVASRVSWGDYNDDGFIDLLINGRLLYRNDGPPNWTFTFVSDEVGLTASGGSAGIWGDYDNDGDLDLYYCVHDVDMWDVLYRNNGPPGWNFTNVTAEAGGLYDRLPTHAAGWGDFDNDGHIDLYVANYEYPANSGEGTMDIFYWNKGDGTFINATAEVGITPTEDRCGRAVAWADYDNDNDLDVYVGNYRLQANFLWESNGRNGFRDVAPEKGVEGDVDPEPDGNDYYGHTIGAAWGDFDNDGNLDLFVANLAHNNDPVRGPICDNSKLYHNEGPSANYTFTNVIDGSGIENKDFPDDEDQLYSGVAWADCDNDGDLDLYITQVYSDISYAYSYLYRNNGNGTFTDITEEAGVRVWDAWGIAWADYDNDGDMDFVVGGRDGSDSDAYPRVTHLFRNDGTPGRWLKVKLQGVEFNRAAIGARVTAIYGRNRDKIQIREVEGGTGTSACQNSMVLHFGFGDYDDTVDLEVRWFGKVQKIRNVTLNQTLEIRETRSPSAVLSVPPILTMNEEAIIDASPSRDDDGIAAYRFDFGDGNITEWLTTPKVTHIYTAPGNYTLGIKVRDIYEVESEWNYTEVYVNSPPVALLSANSTIIRPGWTVAFDFSASYDDREIVRYRLYFGDGEIYMGSSEIVIHAYKATGFFTVSLTVWDDMNLTDMDEMIITVDTPPNADLNVPVSAAPRTNVTIDARASHDPDGDISFYVIDLGDGTVVNTTTPVITHIYNTSGIYVVSLTVVDSLGLRDVDKKEILIDSAPVAHISVRPRSPYVGEEVTIDASGSFDPDGEALTYEFIIGTSTIYLGESPVLVWTFEDRGSHTVIVRVKDIWDISSESSVNIKVRSNRIPVAVLDGPSTEIEGRAVRFSAADSYDPDGDELSYIFDFGDQSSTGWTEEAIADHIYTIPGIYTVTLCVLDGRGAEGRTSLNITITPDDLQVRINYPLDGDVIPLLEITIRGTASSLVRISSVEISIDSSAWVKVDGLESWSYTWHPVEGEHTITVRTSNGLRYVYDSIDLTVQSGMPTSKEGEGRNVERIPSFDGLQAFIAVAIILLFTRYRRRPR